MPNQEGIPLEFPFGGRSDAKAFTKQPGLTTREALNVRGKDPVTGRLRGAQRSGLTQVVAPTSTKIRDMCSLNYVLNEGVAYARRSAGAAVTDWTAEVGKSAVHCDVDRQGNAFFLFSPNLLIKYNPTGTKLAEFAIPLPNQTHTCRALFVDPVLDCIFVGISAGDDPALAKFHMLITEEDGSLSSVWSVAPGQFIEELRVMNDKLYVGCNNPEHASSSVLIYEGLTPNATPALTATLRAPYPIHGLDANGDGDVFAASGLDTTHFLNVVIPTFGTQYLRFRGVHPGAPELRPRLEDWDPSQLDDAENRIWFWWRATDVSAADTADGSAPEEGSEIITMRDRSGFNRHLTKATTAAATNLGITQGANYTVRRGIPALRFNGVAGYESGLNFTIKHAAGQTQKTVLPGYRGVEDPTNTGGLYAAFFLFRLSGDPNDSDAPSSFVSALFHQQNSIGPGNQGQGLYINRTCGATRDRTSSFSQGFVSWYAQLAAGQAGGACGGSPFTARQFLGFDAETDGEETDLCLVTVLWDGGANAGDDVITGTCDAGGSSTVLIDATATFVDDGIQPGDTARNTTDGSQAEVVTVDSQTQITTTALTGGTGNTWANTEAYRINIINYTRCLFRVNGTPVDRGEGQSFLTYGGPAAVEGSFVGFSPRISGAGSEDTNYVGELHEVLVLDRRYRGISEEGPSDTVLSHDKFGSDPGGDDAAAGAQTDNELTRIEAYILHRYGAGHLLPKSGDTYPHPYGLKSSTTYGTDSIMGPPPLGSTSVEARAALNLPSTTKIDATGKKQWVYNKETATEAVVNDFGGAGYAVRVKDSGVYTMGPQADTLNTDITTHRAHARKIIDQGSTFSDDTADGAWVRRNGALASINTMYAYPRPDLDEFKSFYVPWHAGSTSFFDILGDAAGALLQSQALAATDMATVFLHDPRVPDYGDDTVDIARHAYIGFLASATTSEARRLDLVTATITEVAQSRSTHLYVQGQDLRSFTTAGATALISAGIFNASGTVFCVPTRNEVVFLDGSTYQVYDGPAGTVSTLASTSAGDIDLGARLGVFWRSRLILAGFPGVGAKLIGSAIGDIRNWDIAPPREELGSAFRLSINEVDEAPPDTITGLIDASDDLLIIGGTRTITRLTGDPRAGGQMHNMSSSIGMAWGQAWCKDRRDRIFFFGTNPPGLYGIDPGGGIVPLTEGTLEDTEFEDIDFSTSYIRLFYNPRDDGIHIFQFPFGAGGSIRRAWFFEQETHELVQRPPIWPDQFALSGLQPTAGAVLAGLVKGERRLIIGCEDGGLRLWDPDATSDDGSVIDSVVMFPPVTRQSLPRSLALRGLKVFLGTDNHGCLVEYFGSNEADRVGREVQQFNARSGENPTFRRRVRGNNIFVRMRNSRLNERWAFESAYLKLARPQRQRGRR